MAKVYPYLNSMVSGEISEKLLARSDAPVYQTGLRELQNWFVQIEGGVTRRRGWRHVASAKDPSRTAVLLPFRFTTQQAYLLEVGHQYARFYRNGVQISSAGELVSNGTFDSDLTGWTDRSEAGASIAWDAATQALRLNGGVGGNRVTNGTFDSDLTGWTDGSTADGTAVWHSSGTLSLKMAGVQGRALAYQALTGLTVGATYRITYTGATTRGQCWIGTTAGGSETATFGIASGANDQTFVATATTHYVSFTHDQFIGITTEQRVDDVAVEHQGAGHAEQAVAISFPADAHTLRFTVLAGPVVVRVGTTSGGQEVLADASYATGAQSVALTPGTSPVFVGLRGLGGSRTVDAVSLAVTAGGAIEVATPYLESDLKDLSLTQEADTLFVDHPRHAPRRLIRTSHVDWFLQTIDFFDGPYLSENTNDSWTLVADSSGSTVTLTAAGAGFAPFQAGHVGSTWRLTFGTVTKPVRIQAVTDATHATGFVVERIDDGGATGFVLIGGDLGAGFGTPTAVWAEGAWSDVRGWPAVVTKGERRIWHLATATEPAGVWGSEAAAPYSMTLDLLNPLPDQAVDVNLIDLEPIRGAVFAATGLVLQTVGGQTVANGGGPDAAIAPGVIKTRPAGEAGGRVDRALAPRRVGRETLLVDRTGTKLIALAFSFDLEAYEEHDRLRRSGHLADAGGLIGLTRAATPDPTLWCLTEDGRLLTCTYDIVEGVAGWAVQTPGSPAAGPAVVESVAVIPNATLHADEVWVLVRRTVNGATRRDLERLDPTVAVYLDSFLSYAGAATDTLTGLGHLEGETAQVMGDGAFLGEFVVTGGAIALPRAVTSAEVGLGYVSRLRTLPLDVGNRAGSGRLARTGVCQLILELLQTQSLVAIGPGEGAAEQAVVFREAEAPLDQPPPPFTGPKPLWTLGWDDTAQVTLEVREPLPATVLAIGLAVDVEGQ